MSSDTPRWPAARISSSSTRVCAYASSSCLVTYAASTTDGAAFARASTSSEKRNRISSRACAGSSCATDSAHMFTSALARSSAVSSDGKACGVLTPLHNLCVYCARAVFGPSESGRST